MKFVEPARESLLDLGREFVHFRDSVRSTTANHQTPKSRLDRLDDLCDEGGSAVTALLHSLDLVDRTGLDVVDMEFRMKGESRQLADALKEIGEEIADQYFIKRRFSRELVAVDERAQLVAAALYPSAVQGLNRVNSKILEFSRLLMGRYALDLDRLEQDGKLSATRKKTVKAGFTRLGERFTDADAFLNELAWHRLDRDQFRARLDEVDNSLKAARAESQAYRKQSAFKDFGGTLKGVMACANEVRDRLRGLHVPLFPGHADLEELTGCVAKTLYEHLTGLQSFALLNIASRMRQIRIGDPPRHLLSPEFGVRVEKVFPDRVYLDVASGFIDGIGTSAEFQKADASLHAYSDGSYKQTTYPQGNLQVSYARQTGGRFKVDADIDLYRDPLAHLFGEVLVNHLTAGKTDQFRVWNILGEQEVIPIGDFQVATILKRG